MNETKRTRPAPATTAQTSPRAAEQKIRLLRDPRDKRELLTDILGVTVESGADAARDLLDATPTANLLGQRKRQKAWEELQDPLNRLYEEMTLYPTEPLPEPGDADFPTYDPLLPDAPTLYQRAASLRRLLESVAEALPSKDPLPEIPYRTENQPPLPDLPEPTFAEFKRT